MWNGVRRTCDALHSYSGSYFPNLDTAKTKARNSAPLLFSRQRRIPEAGTQRGVTEYEELPNRGHSLTIEVGGVK